MVGSSFNRRLTSVSCDCVFRISLLTPERGFGKAGRIAADFHCDSFDSVSHAMTSFPWLKLIHLFLRCFCGPVVAVITHFRVHVIDCTDGEQVELGNRKPDLHTAEQEQWRRHFAFSFIRFFRLDLRLHIQPHSEMICGRIS